MAISCRQCGANNNSGNRLCLSCGADLPSHAPLTVRPMPPEQPALPRVSGSSIVRPTAEPTNGVSYPFQPEVSASHVGRYLVLVLFSLAVAVAGWQWPDVRTMASRFSKSPATSQSKVTSTQAPVSVLPAEVLTPQSAHPEPSELSKRGQSATEETSSRDPSQEGSVAAVRSSKAQVQRVSASATGRNTSETDGKKYLYGDGVPANCDRAQKDLLAAAQHSSAKAQSALGTMYATGHCAILDLPLAYLWFARAHRQNPRNRIIEEDMRVLWDQMSPEERKLTKR
jgi:hypothetical protein